MNKVLTLIDNWVSEVKAKGADDGKDSIDGQSRVHSKIEFQVANSNVITTLITLKIFPSKTS